MLTVFSPDLEKDADQLEERWGVPVALEMLHEHLITALDFFELCEEVADANATTRALEGGSDPASPSPEARP